MKKILLFLVLVIELFGGIIKVPLLSIDKENETVSVRVDKIDVGISGFISHKIDSNHNSILKSVEVIAHDAVTKIATLKLKEYVELKHNALPSGKWKIQEGDMVILAFAYDRALLIAPSEEIYYRISKSVNIQWVHPDLFATILSFRGHPTPLKEDFTAMSIATSIGLVFIYLDKKVYTVDVKSFKILSISDAPLAQDSEKLPFYTRVQEIDANWWGEGSDELEDYAPHYYELLVKNNKDNRELYKIIEADDNLSTLLKEFQIKEER